MKTNYSPLGTKATDAPPQGNNTRRAQREPSPLAPASSASLANLRERKRKTRRRRWLFFLFTLFFVGVGAGVWWWTRRPETAVDPATLTTTVVRRDFASSVLATGAVKPQVGAQVRVGARVSGKVERLRANIGDAVESGQVIAELEKADLEAIVAQRKAELSLAEARLAAVESLLPKEVDKAEAELQQRHATLALAQQDMARSESLLPTQAISQEDYDRSRERLHVARAAVTVGQQALELAKRRLVEERRQAEADIARAREAFNNAKIQLSYTTLVAPISGVIASVATQEGETVAAGLNAPTFVTIIDLDRLEVNAMVDEVDIGKVRVGQKAVFTVDSYPAREFPGKVVAIYPDAVLLENVVYYNVVLDIQGNEDKVLRPQMTASATIFLDVKSGALAVPAKAVKRERGKNVVYVLKDGQPQARQVKVGWKDGTWIEIASGLEEGETILQTPPANLPAIP
jgi:multidrug resistance efflux pump